MPAIIIMVVIQKQVMANKIIILVLFDLIFKLIMIMLCDEF